MDPIRVLHIVTSMNIGGIENFIMTVYRNIDRTRVQFDFLKHRDSHDFYDDEIVAMGGRIYCLPPINPLKQRLYDKAASHFFREHKETYKIVHSHINTFSAYPLRIARREGYKVLIAHAHATTKTLDIKTPFRLYTKCIITKYITDAFACSAAAGKWLFKDFSYEIIPNVIEANRFFYMESIKKDVRAELGIDNAAYIIGMVANFSAIKNHEYLVSIFSGILKEIPNSYLVFVGDGEMRSDIEDKVHRMGFDNRVVFLGQREDVPRLLQALDVFALPSITEGFSISALEAETVGVPCVLSTGIPKDVKLFSEMNTCFLPLQDKNAWIAKIVSLKDVKKKNWVQEVSETRYDAKTSSEKLLEFYEKKYKTVADGVHL